MLFEILGNNLLLGCIIFFTCLFVMAGLVSLITIQASKLTSNLKRAQKLDSVAISFCMISIISLLIVLGIILLCLIACC